MSCSSASPRLDTDRPINTPMTARKILIFLFTIPYSPPFRLSKELFQNLLKIDLSNPINKVYSTLYLCGGSSRNNIAATPPQHIIQNPAKIINQYFHFWRDILCGAIWWLPVIIQATAKQTRKNRPLNISQNTNREDIILSCSTPRSGRQIIRSTHPKGNNRLCVFL